MEPVLETQPANTAPPVTSSPGLFGTKMPASITFLIAILLFLLPFAEIRCNGTAFANNTGLGIAMGSDWKTVASNNLFGNGFGNTTANEDKIQKREANLFAIIALGLGVIGLLIAFLIPNGGGKLNLVIGILSAVSLIAMLIDLKSDAKSDNSLKSSEMGVNAGVSVTVDGTGWLYFTILLFILGGIFSYMRIKKNQPS